MNVLCLLQGDGPFQAGLRGCLQAIADGAIVEYCASLNSLLFRLRYHACRPETVVLLEADLELLDQLIEYRELFSDIPMVLLVADEDESALAKGHLLRPRFMTSLDGDPKSVKDVLCNLLQRQRQENQLTHQC